MTSCEAMRNAECANARSERPRRTPATTTPTTRHQGERGFTLAAVLIILTVMLVFLAYTVPRMWSDVLRRERDYETIWVMKQYARAIKGYVDVRKVYPTKLDDLTMQNKPRVLRHLYPNPLSGKMDWVLIPFGTATGDQLNPNQNPDQNQQNPPPQGPITTPGQAGSTGPFIGVRPPQTGKSFLIFRTKEKYNEWLYTTNELEKDIAGNVGMTLQAPQGGAAPLPP